MSYKDYKNDQNACITFCPALAISKLFGSRLAYAVVYILVHMVQVSSFQIPCESFAQNSKFDKFQKMSIICNTVYLL